MTVLLTPDKKPFYVGTYFPKRQKFGRPRIMEILQQIADMWRDDRQRILESGDKITEAIKPHFRSFSKGELSEDTLKKGYDRLLARPKELYDGAIPSGNSVMAYNLIRHNRLVGSERFGDYADQQLRAFSAQVNNYPPGYSFFLLALQLALGTSQEIVIAEGENVEEFGDMVSYVQQSYLPFAVYVMKGKELQDEFTELAPAHADKGPVNGKTALYVCENFACQQPVTSLAEAKAQLHE